MLAWGVVWRVVHCPPWPAAHVGTGPRESLWQAVGKFGALLRLPRTWGSVLLAGVGCASFISLRRLWLGPLLLARHGFSLVGSGKVALAMSLAALIGPPLFGQLDPGPALDARLFTLLLVAALFAVLSLTHRTTTGVLEPIAIGGLSGSLVWQYAELRDACPPAITGRAMAVLTMAMFLGVAVTQAFTGWLASSAAARSVEPFSAVLGSIDALLVAGTAAFVVLPAPKPLT